MNLPRFGVRNPVPVNLLMAGLILAGIYSSFTLRRQFFPDMEFDKVVVSMSFPGASPEDVESAIAMRLENAIFQIDEVDEIRTTCVEGNAEMFWALWSASRQPQCRHRPPARPCGTCPKVRRAPTLLEDAV